MTAVAWMMQGLAVAATVALFFLPGYLLARIVNIRGLLAWAVAPAVTAVVSALGSTIMAPLGVRWNLLSFAVTALAIAALLAGVRWLLRHEGALGLPPVSWLSRILMVLAGIALALPFVLTVGPNDVIQQIDPTFHMNAIALIQDTGNASSFGGLTRMFGMETATTTFPANWHALTSLIAPYFGVVTITNTMAIVVPIIWVSAIAAFARAASPFRNARTAATIALIPAIVVVPTFITSRYPILPNALQIAMTPAVLALLLAAVTLPAQVRARIVYTLLGIGALLGVALIHPSVIFSVLILTVLPGAYFLSRRWRVKWAHDRRQFWIESSVFAGIAVAALAIVALVPGVADKLRNMSVQYMTEPGPLLDSVPKALAVWPMVTAEAGSAATIPLTMTQGGILVLTVVGLVRLSGTPRGRYVVLMWVAAMLLTFTVLARQGPLVGIAGLWYMSPHRTMSIQAIPQLLVMGTGLAWVMHLLGEKIGNYRRVILALSLAAVLVTGALTFNARSYLYRSVYHPQTGELAKIASADELAMIRSLSDTLPKDALVLGDPFNGSALVEALADRNVVFPQLFFRTSNFDENILRYQFRLVNSSPLVCDIVNKRGITHLYLDSDSTSFGRDNTAEAPGLYGVDTDSGFTKVAEGGTASVWRIDACEASKEQK